MKVRLERNIHHHSPETGLTNTIVFNEIRRGWSHRFLICNLHFRNRCVYTRIFFLKKAYFIGIAINQPYRIQIFLNLLVLSLCLPFKSSFSTSDHIMIIFHTVTKSIINKNIKSIILFTFSKTVFHLFSNLLNYRLFYRLCFTFVTYSWYNQLSLFKVFFVSK